MSRKTIFKAPLFTALSLSLCLPLAGCDAGKEPLAKAAAEESEGKFAEAAAHYEEVCTKGSKLCDTASKLVARLKVKQAWKLIDEGQYVKAAEALKASTQSSDPAAKRAAEEALKYFELTQGLAWEEASAMADKKQARPKMEEIAAAGALVSPKAREWIAKNRPALLLEQVKAACKPGGQGSCAEAGEALSSLHSGSPESAEAKGLVDAEYARIYTRIKEAENLLIQRVAIHDRDKLVERCVENNTSLSPGQDKEQECKEANTPEQMPPIEFLTKAWEKKLSEVGDPYYVKRFEERWTKAGDAGEHDPEPWPKPEGKK
jgi:hypothetical protein